MMQKDTLAQPTPARRHVAAQGIRGGLELAEINRVAGYDLGLLDRIPEIVAAEEDVCRNGLPRDAEGLRRLKAMGFSDKRLAYLALQSANLQPGAQRATARGSGLIHDTINAMTGGVTAAEVRKLRHRLGVRPAFKTNDKSEEHTTELQ